jgi:hypothetical protein
VPVAANSRKDEVSRRVKQVKSIMFGLMIIVFALGLAGCDQAQKALDTIDKAKAITDDVQKKAKEVTDSARSLIPGNDSRSQKDTGEGRNDGGQKRGDHGNEKDD